MITYQTMQHDLAHFRHDYLNHRSSVLMINLLDKQ